MIDRPTLHKDYNEFYQTYVGKVPEGDVLALLSEGPVITGELLSGLSVEQETYAYAPGKWTVREVLGHMLDTERLFAYRALSIARDAQQVLPGMDQDVWASASSAADRPVSDQLAEWELVRRGNVAMFRGFGPRQWSQVGSASGFPFAVRAFPFVMAGHEIHHCQVLAERYFK